MVEALCFARLDPEHDPAGSAELIEHAHAAIWRRSPEATTAQARCAGLAPDGLSLARNPKVGPLPRNETQKLAHSRGTKPKSWPTPEERNPRRAQRRQTL